MAVIPNCTKHGVSDMYENDSLHTTVASIVKEDPTISCDWQPETLSGQSKDQCIESNSNLSKTMAIIEEVSMKEILVDQNRISTTNSGNVSETISNDTEIMLLEKEDNITFVNEHGNGENLCQKSRRNIECISTAAETDTLRKDVDNVKTPDLREKAENNIYGNKRNRRMCEVKYNLVPVEYQEDCIFCINDNSKLKNKSRLVTMKTKNLEIEQTAVFEEATSGMCSLQLSHTNKSDVYSKRENVKKLEIDLMQSASSISNKSSASNISGNSETTLKCKSETALESNQTILSRRQKQIEYGKNTAGYRRYKEMIPKDQRTRQDPQTPPKSVKYSRRAWDGLIKTWRRKLHNWDPPKSEESDEIISLISPSFSKLFDGSENLDTPIGKATEKQQLSDQIEIDGMIAM